jgi:hypothetical protein
MLLCELVYANSKRNDLPLRPLRTLMGQAYWYATGAVPTLQAAQLGRSGR